MSVHEDETRYVTCIRSVSSHGLNNHSGLLRARMDDGSEQLPCDFLSSEEMILPSERPQSPLGNEEARETFEGEGSEELAARTDELGSSSVMNALKQLVELCDAPENGVVALDKFMDVIENQGFQCSPQDIHSLNQVYNALCAESESKGLFTTGGSGKRDFQVDIHNSKVIRDLLDHYQSRAHLEEIWEPGLSLLLDPSKSGGANPDGNSALLSTPPRRRPCGGGEGSDADDGSSARVGGGHCSSGGSSPATCSSAGILASLEVSMFSTGSKEGTGGDISFLDVAQYEAERAQYQHTIQRLMKQKEDAMRQWSQLDEAHQALAATNKDLVERVRSLCQEMESLKRACSELEETKASLVVTSATCRQAEQLLSQARAAKAALEDQLEERHAQVDSLNERLAKCQDSEKRAVLLASQHRQHLRELEARNQDLEAHLSREASRLNESTAVVKELTSTVESLKQTWKDTEDELRQERDANFRLKELLFERSLLHGSDYYDAVKGDTVESDSATMTSAEANLDSDEGVFNSRSISPASVFFPGDCSPRPICDELSLSALDLQCTSTPRPSQSPAKRPRLPFCGISRLPTWDCSAIQHWYLDEGRLNSVLLSQSSHSSLPPRITALVQENLASAGAEALQANLQQELEKKEQVIKELEAKVSATREEWSALEHRHTELWTFLGHSLAALRGIRNDLTMLNDEAVRALESHAGAAAILAGAQQDRQLVSALEDVSPESTYSFPEDVVREQIQLELQTLRAQITKSQAVLTYLQSRGSRTLPQPVSECTTINRKALVPHRGYSEEGVHPDDRHYDTLEAHRRPRRASGCQACGCAARCRGRHAGRLSSTLSCPALPARDSLMARSTQTEPTTTMRSRDCQTDDELDIVGVDLVCDDASVVQGTLVEASARTTSSLPGSLSPPFPRHRSNSFVCAIQGGANRTPDEGWGVSGERSSPADTSSAKPKVPMLTFEDFDAQRRETEGQTRKAAFRKCLLEVGRSVAMDLDQPDSSAGTPRPRVPLKKTTFMLERPETESAQGSLEGQEAFPSFTDAVLVSQGLSKDSPSSDQLSEEEIENKFTTLSLGFKTDRLTLTKRLELHQRHRDIAEGNIQAELKAIRDLAQTLDSLYTDDERVREVVAKIRNHLDVIQQSTDRVSSQAEVYGAVQQDSRGRLSSIPGGSVAGTANSAAGAVRAFRALNLGARRCSLPVPHAMHLPSPTLAHDADAGARAGEAGGKTECHLEEDTASSSVVNAEGLHLHLGARDVGNNAGSSSMAPHEHNGLCADDSSTLQNGVLEELVAAAVQDTLERSDRLNGVEEMDGDDLRAHGTEDEGQEGDADGRVREGLASGHMDVGSIDLLHWAATVVLRVKYWLNRSRQVLAGRKRLAPVTKQRFNAARYFLGGLLVTAALVTVLVVLFPGASSCSLATNRASLVMLWHDLCHRGPGLVMRWSGGPPPV